MDKYAARIVSAVSAFIREYEDEENIHIVEWISGCEDQHALLCAIAKNIVEVMVRGPFANRVAHTIQKAINSSVSIQPFDLIAMIWELRNKRGGDAGEAPTAKRQRLYDEGSWGL